MTKTILSIKPTSHQHSAVGRVYQVIFLDYTVELVYEETFYHQFKDFNSFQYLNLIGKELNVEVGFFKLDLAF